MQTRPGAGDACTLPWLGRGGCLQSLFLDCKLAVVWFEVFRHISPAQETEQAKHPSPRGFPEGSHHFLFWIDSHTPDICSLQVGFSGGCVWCELGEHARSECGVQTLSAYVTQVGLRALTRSRFSVRTNSVRFSQSPIASGNCVSLF